MSQKQQGKFSTSSITSEDSGSSDGDIADLARLVNNIQLSITEVQQQTLVLLSILQ